MALMRWEPFREMETLRRQMDQLFDELTQANREAYSDSPGAKAAWAPAIELSATEGALVLKAEIPGVEAKDLDVQVSRDKISITGERRYEQRPEAGSVRSEFRYGKFQRLIALPTQIQHDQVKADFQNGLLTLTLPKLEAERNKVFKVNLTENQSAISAEATAAESAESIAASN